VRHRLDVLRVLTTSDLRVRYGRGRLRFLKWVLDPLAALGVYLLLVSLVLARGEDAIGLSLACAVVPFTLLMASVVNALTSVQLRGSILLNMGFPRMLIPIASVTTETVAFTASLVLLPVMMLVYDVGPTLSILWLPVALAITVVLALAFAYPSTLFGIWYPELQPFAVSFARAAFFIAAGLVALDEVTGTARDLLPFNPLTGLFETYRDALLYGHSPAAWELLAPLAAAAVILAISVPLYMREQSRMAKLLG
jgi:ABC-type polysaccharide/polyol phosphate export permease